MSTDAPLPADEQRSARRFWDDVQADPQRTAQQFWDDFYATRTWSEHGPVNRQLVREVEAVPPGTALDLGCAEGADALWLARHGWIVLGVDVAAAALGRARAHADRLGLGDQVAFEQHDLATGFPTGRFDLVSVQFLHSPVAAAGEREQILRRAAEAVAPGGRLLVVSHHGMPTWAEQHPAAMTLPTPEQTVAALRLDDDRWRTVRSEVVATEVESPDGRPGTRLDHVLHALRTPAAP
ncbi:MAG TPA: methyltransferase domain-containing protein [Cellulomonas sp.]